MIVVYNSVQFDLRDEGGLFRWYFPDGRPTSVARETEAEAARAMLYMAEGLAREYALEKLATVQAKIRI
jgi:hypothetical protein